MTTVSPSPRELVARLTDEEKIAVDRLLQIEDEPFVFEKREEAIVLADPDFMRLVPDAKRRMYLRSLALQLAALGIEVFENSAFDAAQRQHVEYAEAHRKRDVEYAATIAKERLQEQARLEALPPDVRRAVERNQRRRRNRRGRRP